ncbi:methylated-DNA--[protein]-cysteine S-methyltransferase [Maridesulfovibrio hydrothermalis]|uniref:Methylated-DNA--protein-cysteine methyltransferase n=1 Tax=Maridesulfovibrio hydrothermalis AM13 = DSM 14728 TaxID=1121451 RepID=L0RFB4_9BACT|nr:methylated-DNA--[protein]-cysteine S-methyltransferase [Maridesulfovibrio hydrothermalis]CCO25473.1 Methylated-DNA--protein-cysteine methyltransferase [Maridesulfovibrio hydrothermalis AM13 = DSM 14728]
MIGRTTVYYTTFMSPLCGITLVGNKAGLIHLHLQTGEGKKEFSIAGHWVRDDKFFIEAASQINDFCAGSRTFFKLKLNPQGTEFQKRVWEALRTIPYGETRSYKQVAEKIGNKNAGRAVGMANSKNPIPLIIPCHRVVGANGALTGFAHGLTIKQKLIELERGVMAAE